LKEGKESMAELDAAAAPVPVAVVWRIELGCAQSLRTGLQSLFKNFQGTSAEVLVVLVVVLRLRLGLFALLALALGCLFGRFRVRLSRLLVRLQHSRQGTVSQAARREHTQGQHSQQAAHRVSSSMHTAA